MPTYIGFYHETIVIIAEALNFVSKRMEEFFEAQKGAVDASHHVLIDEEYKKQIQEIDDVREFLVMADDMHIYHLDEKTHAAFMDIIRSALEVLLQDTLDARAKTGLPAFDSKIEEIRRTISLEGLKNRETKLFEKYYQARTQSIEGRKVEVFLSYAHENRVLAGKIASFLKNKDIDVFLAHEDIEVSKEWRREILKHLKMDRILIALLTPEYEKSVWTNQEAGYVLGKEGKNIPLIVGNVDIKRFGFLESFQGIPILEENIEDSIDEIIKAILK
jgi:hypothetical protein